MYLYFSLISITGIDLDFFFSFVSDNDDDEIVDKEWLVVEPLDEDDDEELDRLLLLLVLELDRFRFDPLSIDDELKRMSMECQDEFISCQCSHPFTNDLHLVGDPDNRIAFEVLSTNK